MAVQAMDISYTDLSLDYFGEKYKDFFKGTKYITEWVQLFLKSNNSTMATVITWMGNCSNACDPHAAMKYVVDAKKFYSQRNPPPDLNGHEASSHYRKKIFATMDAVNNAVYRTCESVNLLLKNNILFLPSLWKSRFSVLTNTTLCLAMAVAIKKDLAVNEFRFKNFFLVLQKVSIFGIGFFALTHFFLGFTLPRFYSLILATNTVLMPLLAYYAEKKNW